MLATLRIKKRTTVLAMAYFCPKGLSSALKGLTAKFGMGLGVALSLKSPRQWFFSWDIGTDNK
jgi:hypothetical protein